MHQGQKADGGTASRQDTGDSLVFAGGGELCFLTGGLKQSWCGWTLAFSLPGEGPICPGPWNSLDAASHRNIF